MQIKLPNGKVISGIPEGTSKEDIADKVVSAGMATYEELGVSPKGTDIGGIAEAGQAVGANVLGAVGAGLGGIYELIKTGNPEKAAEAVKFMQQDIAKRFAPETRYGQSALEEVGQQLGRFEESLKPLAAIPAGASAGIMNPLNFDEAYRQNYQSVMDKGIGKYLGESTMQATGSPLAATTAELLPDIAEIATGRIAGKSASGPKMPSRVVDDALTDGQKIVKSGDELGVSVLTSDVKPPTSYIGKWSQRINEKLGPLGSGVARQIQQKARQDVVDNIAQEFNINMDSPFFEEIINSMTAKNTRKLEAANSRRRKAIDKLSSYGDVETDSINAAIARQVEKQNKLKGAASSEVLKDIQTYQDALSGQDFDGMAAVRTELIRKIKDMESSTSETKTSRLQALNDIKKSIDEDMNRFAKSNDDGAAAQWLKSNKELAEQLTTVKQSELNRLINKGDVKPEMVSTILKGGKPSELKRLKESLGKDGLRAARSAIIKDALDRSGFFRGDPNPNKFATELGKTNTQKAINALFSKEDKMQLDGLRKLLNATRRSQDASLVTETGAQLIPATGAGLIGAGVATSPIATLATATTISALAKAYESKPFRNLLLSLEKSKSGSLQERRILDKLIPAVVAAQQAPKEEQQQMQ